MPLFTQGPWGTRQSNGVIREEALSQRYQLSLGVLEPEVSHVGCWPRPCDQAPVKSLDTKASVSFPGWLHAHGHPSLLGKAGVVRDSTRRHLEAPNLGPI